MRTPRVSIARAVVGMALALLLGAPALAAPPSTLGSAELAGSLGNTFAILGDVREGGAALELRALWPMGGASSPISVGFGLWAADAGQRSERLLDPDTGDDLGAVGGPSLTTYGGGLAADLHPGLGGARGTSAAPSGPYLSGTGGIFVVSATRLGDRIHSGGSVGWSAGGGWRFRLGNRVTVGPAVHYHRVFDDRLGRFMAAGLDWVWR